MLAQALQTRQTHAANRHVKSGETRWPYTCNYSPSTSSTRRATGCLFYARSRTDAYVEEETGEEVSIKLGLQADRRLQQVVQVKTQHAIPSFNRPWEGKNDAFSTASAFVVSLNDGQQKLLCTTAGAVEHARKIKVRKVGHATEQEVEVAAACLDADVALLSCSSPGFWDGLEAVSFQGLPSLQEPVTVVGFPIGGESFCLTRGVVSRVEVVEYSHSGRSLLALQVDASMNNGVWGGPLFDSSGRVVGMALQKSSSQIWMERYDEDSFLGDMEGNGDSEEESSEEEGGDGGEEEDDDDAENVGYAIPALLLQNVLHEYEAAARLREHPLTSSSGSSSPAILRASSRHEAVRSSHDGQQGRRRRSTGGRGTTAMAGSVDDSGSGSRASGIGAWGSKVALTGPPYLGVRWRPLESLALRRSLGLQEGDTGVLITAVDPSGSAASGGPTGQPPATTAGLHAGTPAAQPLSVTSMVPSSQGTASAGPHPHGSNSSSSSNVNGCDRGGGLHQGDVLLALQTADGLHRISCDGTIALSPDQRVLFGHCTSVRRAGEEVLAHVLRGGMLLELPLTLRNPPPFIPSALGRGVPAYLILGGLVLLQFSQPLLHTTDLSPTVKRRMGQKLPSWCGGFDVGTLAALDWGMPSTDGEQVVVGCEVLAGSWVEEAHGAELLSSPYCTGRGGESLPRRLIRINDIPVHNLQAVAQWVVHNTNSLGGTSAQSLSKGAETPEVASLQGPGASARSSSSMHHREPGLGIEFLRLEFSDGYLLLLDTASLKEDTRAALAQHGINDAMPSCLQPEGSNWPFEGASNGHSRQKRQQRRRLALRR